MWSHLFCKENLTPMCLLRFSCEARFIPKACLSKKIQIKSVDRPLLQHFESIQRDLSSTRDLGSNKELGLENNNLSSETLNFRFSLWPIFVLVFISRTSAVFFVQEFCEALGFFLFQTAEVEMR